MAKKNKLTIFGTKFRITKTGSVLPAPRNMGKSAYQSCVAGAMKASGPHTGKSQNAIRKAFQAAATGCSGSTVIGSVATGTVGGSTTYEGKKARLQRAQNKRKAKKGLA